MGGAACAGGEILCNNTCVDPSSSLTNCGACGVLCPAGNKCMGGACVPVCGSGQALCNGACASLQTDPASCGACGNACPAGLSCVAGACGCPAGEVLCDGACIDPENDPSYCGAAGACQGADAGGICAQGEVCADGVCSATCAAGKSICGDACFDLAVSNDHCGACNNACPAGSACLGGSCATVGPLYLASKGSTSIYTMDLATGQTTPAPGQVPNFHKWGFTYDRRNAHFYYGMGGDIKITKDDFTGQIALPVSIAAYQIVHDPSQDLFYVGGWIGTYGIRKMSVQGQMLGQISLPGPTVVALAHDPHHHRLYALAGTALYRYEIATDVWTLVADAGIPWGDTYGNGYYASLAYDPSDEQLYLTHFSELGFPGTMTPTFRQMNPKTGATTVISTLSASGLLAFSFPGDGSQCLPLGEPCGVFSTCHLYEVCVSQWPPPEFPHCVSVMGAPNYCSSCATMGSMCPQGTSCSYADNSYMTCQ